MAQRPLAGPRPHSPQQYFLRTLSQTAIHKTGSDILKINNLLNSAFQESCHDQTLKYGELTSLAYTFRDLDPGKINMSTIPWTTDPANGNRVIPKWPDWTFVANACRISRHRRSRS